MERCCQYEDTGLTPEEIMDGKMLTGWVPVEEKLPSDEVYVLVTCQLRRIKISGNGRKGIMKESMELLEKALAECKTVPDYLSKAICVTKQNSIQCSKISWWKDGLWELIAEFLNTHPDNVQEEYFMQACALLEAC